MPSTKNGGVKTTKTQEKTERNKRITKTSYGEKRCRVDAVGVLTKDGLIVCILGGDKPHVGALALGMPRPSLKDSDVTSATSSVFTLLGHKDDEIARPLSEMFAKEFKQAAVVIAGVHVEGADEETIAKLASNSTEAARKLLQKLKEKQNWEKKS